MDASSKRISPTGGKIITASSQRLAFMLVLAGYAFTLAVSVSGCGSTQNRVELPDLATKSPKAPSNKNVMSGAEQKRAIDSMIARREEQERVAREAAGTR